MFRIGVHYPSSASDWPTQMLKFPLPSSGSSFLVLISFGQFVLQMIPGVTSPMQFEAQLLNFGGAGMWKAASEVGASMMAPTPTVEEANINVDEKARTELNEPDEVREKE